MNIEFKKTKDITEQARRTDSWVVTKRSVVFETLYYGVRFAISFKAKDYIDDKGEKRLSVSSEVKIQEEIAEGGNSIQRYLPSVYVEWNETPCDGYANVCKPDSLSIQTTSFGALSTEKFTQLLHAEKITFEVVQAIEKLFLQHFKGDKADLSFMDQTVIAERGSAHV